MICPVTRRVEEKQRLVLDRIYPGKGRPVVQPGQKVADADIIAHCEVSAGQRLIKIAHDLGVSGKGVDNYLTRKVGDRIYEGEIIARKRGPLGIGKKEIKSPVDGLITEIDERGDLILKFLPTPVRLLAGASGEVKEVDKTKISISTIGTKINGFVALGRAREGIISVIGNSTEFILPGKINADSRGRILVGGALLERSALEKAVTLGAVAIITGGMNYRDFSTLGGGEDIGTTIMVTEGFGSAPMGDDIWAYLKQKQGRFAFISGEENHMIVPELSAGSTTAKSATPGKAWRELRIGDKVRFLRKESSDLLGEVKEMPGEQILNSGLLAEVSRVSFTSGQNLLLPAANLEIIE